MNGIISGISGLVDGALIQQVRYETISNNLANLSTKGFKRDALSFNEVLTQKMYSASDFSQGPIQYTGNPVDLALNGKGFFKIQTPKGLRYTRNGTFGLGKDNTLVTQKGDPVLGDSGPIRVDGTEISVGTDGQVEVNGVLAGRISRVDFKNPGRLLKEGANYYVDPGEAQELPGPDKTTVHQGYLEESNVDMTEEMIRMVEASRAFESIQKGIQSMDEATGKLINDSGLF
jgi:flagellar basal-body rod protein FlgG